ncbi:MAG: hypothetical protein XD91_1345 [Clostridiales bacterium 38_11]|nr:MAG: hypothetical protein XD91_1345 [Clostridiales bacterium 38_11]HBH12229.1 hypothetical protein [Clostridiales bacterium]
MEKLNIKTTIIIMIVAVIGYMAINNFVLTPETPEGALKDEEGRKLATELYTVVTKTLIEDLNYLGTVESETTAVVSSKATGNILEIYFAEGTLVNADEIIMVIDQEQLLAKKESVIKKQETLTSQLDFLEYEVNGFNVLSPLVAKIASIDENIDYQREELLKLEALFESGAVAKSKVDQAIHQINLLELQKTEVETSKRATYDQLVQEKTMVQKQLEEIDASLDEINLSIEETNVKAPFDGQIRQLFMSEGDLAAVGKPMLSIEKISDVKVTTNVGESDLSKIQIGVKAEVVLSGSEKIYIGEVVYKSSSVNPKTRIGDIEIKVDIPENKIVIGSSAKIRLILQQTEQQVVIPADAVKTLLDKEVVYVLDGDDRVHEREIILGTKSNGWFQVISGLTERETIAIKNIQSLQNGSEIYVIDRRNGQ